MSAGRFAADFVWRIVERIRERPKAVARRAAKAARKALRRRQHDEAGGEFFQPEEDRNMAVNTGLRSSSNMVIAGGLTNIVVEVLQMVWPEFQLSPEMRTYLTLGIAWLASRFTKTPTNAGVV